MAEIILEPTALSKIIPISLKINDTDATAVTRLATKRQFNTSDTDAWLSFALEGLESTSGVYDLTMVNVDENPSSVVHHTNVAFSAIPFYYKMDSGADLLTNEIRHAGRWIGQVVVRLANGDTTSRQFDFAISGHLLDGNEARIILVEDYNALIATITASKTELEGYNVDYSALLVDIGAAENARIAAYNQLLADQQANINAFDVALDTGIVAANLATKLQDFETTNNSRLLSAEQQLEQVLTNGSILGSRFALMSDSIGKAPFYDGEGGYDATVNRVGETWITTASVASGGIIRVGINAAIAGNTTQQMLDRFDVDLGGANFSKWDTLTLCGGVNDSAYTVLQTRDNLEAMAIKALKAGKNVVFCTLFPSNEHATRVRIRKINYLMTQLAAKYHAPLVDFHTRFLDPVTARWIEGYYYDQLHPNLLGVNTAGKLFAEKITPYVQNATPFLAQDNLDTRVMINGTVYNPLWLLDANADGTPDGFTKSANPGGFTIEFGSNPTFDAIANRCKIVAVNTGSLGEIFANAAYASDKWAVGDICQFACKYKFTPGLPNTVAPRFFVRVVATGSASGYAYQQEMQGALDGVLVTEPFAVPTGTTALSVRVGMMGGVGELEFSRFTPINLTKQLMI